MTFLSDDQKRLAYKYRKARLRLTKKLDLIPTQAELAERWGCSQKTICKAMTEMDKRRGRV